MQPYVPDALPLNDLDYRLLLPLVGQASAALARYDGLLQRFVECKFIYTLRYALYGVQALHNPADVEVAG